MYGYETGEDKKFAELVIGAKIEGLLITRDKNVLTCIQTCKIIQFLKLFRRKRRKTIMLQMVAMYFHF